MKNYVFHLKQSLSPYKTKRIELVAENSREAHKKVFENFPNWEVSMFWYA